MTTSAPPPAALPHVAAPAATPRQSGRMCVQCQTTETPLWRVGPAGPKTLCNACGVRRSKALRKKQQAAAAAAAAAAGEPPPPTGSVKKKAAGSGGSGAGTKTAAAAAGAGFAGTKAGASDVSAAGRLPPASTLPRGPGGVVKKRRPRATPDGARAGLGALDKTRDGHPAAVGGHGHGFMRQLSGALAAGGGSGLGVSGGGAVGSSGGSEPCGFTGGWQSRSKGAPHGWPQQGEARGGGGSRLYADDRYAGGTVYEDPLSAYAPPYADLRGEPRYQPRPGAEEPYPPPPVTAYATHGGRPFFQPPSGPLGTAASPSSPTVALSAAAARSYTHVFGGRLPPPSAYAAAYPPRPRSGRRVEAEGDVDSGVTADDGAEEEGARFRRGRGGGSGGSADGVVGRREAGHGPPPPPPPWSFWPGRGGPGGSSVMDNKDDRGRVREPVYWPRPSFAYQLRVPLEGERENVGYAETERLPERPPPGKSWPRSSTEVRYVGRCLFRTAGVSNNTAASLGEISCRASYLTCCCVAFFSLCSFSSCCAAPCLPFPVVCSAHCLRHCHCCFVFGSSLVAALLRRYGSFLSFLTRGPTTVALLRRPVLQTSTSWSPPLRQLRTGTSRRRAR